MAQTADTQLSDGGLVEPMTLQQRKARGFCTCPPRSAAGAETPPEADPCGVHPKHLLHSEEHNLSHGFVFFDDRRNRYVTWADAVEGMRQPRYAGATSKGLVLYTWMNLMRLLEALCYPMQEPAAEITEQSAERLITLAGRRFPPDALANLIHFARGGGTEALCTIFRTVARNTRAGHSEGEGAHA